MTFRLFFLFAFACLTAFQGAQAQSIMPARSDGNTRVLTIYSSLDEHVSKPLLVAFQQQRPNVEIHYYDLQSLEIYERTIEETDAGRPTADLLISSAMDLQIKLANDGYSQPVSDIQQPWPKWAKWRESVFGLTFEPSVIVYHKPSFAGNDVPDNRSELNTLLNDDAYFGRIGTYDIERSGLGYLFLARDAEHDRDLWKLVNAMGNAGVKLYSSSSSILERVADGRLAVGYNILGSYAQAWTDKQPELGIIHPEDFTVVMSRIALVPKSAKNPDLGREMLSYLMSETGQTIMANDLKLPAIHPAVGGPNTASGYRKQFGARLRPITIGPGLVAYLDQVKRARFIRKWNKSLRGE
ncbi:MAG: ABC transporter substrate-binding protein [Pseudomonadota bacterium]